MRICHISTEKGFRGGERQLARIHEGLLSAGEESIVICRSDNSALASLPFSRTIRYRGFDAFTVPFRLLYEINRVRPDCIHCHDSRSLSLIALIRRWLTVPVLVSRKTVYPITPGRSSDRKFQAVDHLIAVSQAAAEVVLQHYPDMPVTVIHDGVEATQGDSRETVRQRLNIDKSLLIFASVGYFSSEKNVPLLLKTADTLRRYPQARLLLVGPVKACYREEVEAHPVILSPGRIDDAEKLYRGFDCYLSTSTREGLGSALLDAVVRDLPAIALDSGGSRDIFAPHDPDHCMSESAFLKRVEQFVESGADNERVRERGALARERFSRDLLVRKHVGLYSKIAEK